MAKAKNNVTTPQTTSIAIPADFALEVFGHKLTAEALEGMTPNAVAYLVGNGFSQSMTDSGALSKEFKKGKSEKEIAGILADKRTSRYNAILNGSVGAVRGTRATPLAVFERQVAEEQLKAHLKKRGKPAPKGAILKAGIQWFLDHRAADIKAEAEARMAAANAAVEGDLNVPDFDVMAEAAE